MRRTLSNLLRYTGAERLARWWRLRFETPLEKLPQSPDYFRIYRHFVAESEFVRFPGGWVYRGEKYPDYLFLGGASFAIFRIAQRYLKGYGIDIGAGYWEFPGSIPVDPWRGEGLRRRIDDFPLGSLDYVFSSHTLEHIDDWKGALVRWVSLLKRGGRLFLYLPHPDCLIWRRGAPGIGEGHKWVPHPEAVAEALANLKLSIVARDDGPDGMMSFFICAENG